MKIFLHGITSYMPDGSSTADLLAQLPPGLLLWGESAPGYPERLAPDPAPLIEGAWYWAEPEGVEPCQPPSARTP